MMILASAREWSGMWRTPQSQLVGMKNTLFRVEMRLPYPNKRFDYCKDRQAWYN